MGKKNKKQKKKQKEKKGIKVDELMPKTLLVDPVRPTSNLSVDELIDSIRPELEKVVEKGNYFVTICSHTEDTSRTFHHSYEFGLIWLDRMEADILKLIERERQLNN